MPVKWDDRAFKAHVDNETVKLLSRIGIRGESRAKQLITGKIDPELKAIDKGRLRASLTHEVDAAKLLVRIGTNVKYAIFVFLGHITRSGTNVPAKPVLRRMLMILKAELKGK